MVSPRRRPRSRHSPKRQPTHRPERQNQRPKPNECRPADARPIRTPRPTTPGRVSEDSVAPSRSQRLAGPPRPLPAPLPFRARSGRAGWPCPGRPSPRRSQAELAPAAERLAVAGDRLGPSSFRAAIRPQGRDVQADRLAPDDRLSSLAMTAPRRVRVAGPEGGAAAERQVIGRSSSSRRARRRPLARLVEPPAVNAAQARPNDVRRVLRIAHDSAAAARPRQGRPSGRPREGRRTARSTDSSR